ncbi:MAG: hypothetical protein EZS28_021598 [Streblomastix strix]|uniref:Uncharacterized protein n=1 Tax=Streblomastix strix TaxID=222440 RepID=A0A5J4VK28_9EUKA|nr:MAG: hypothetical protein EZS28_021598 [Streblomastix strix]
MRQARKLLNIYMKYPNQIDPPRVLKGDKVFNQLRDQFNVIDPNFDISDEGLRVFKNFITMSSQKDASKLLFGLNWEKISQDQHLMKRIVQNDDARQLLDEQQEQWELMLKEAKENFDRLVKQNEGIKDPHFSEPEQSIPVPINPKRIVYVDQDFNINARLDQPSNQMGSMAQPPNPDIQLMQLGQVAPKEYVNILQQQDGEQTLTTTLPEEDALQQRLDEQPNQQPNQQFNNPSSGVLRQLRQVQLTAMNVGDELSQQQASQFIRDQMQQGQAKDQMGQEVQATYDEIIQGLKYVVGATGWGKQPINQFINQQHFPDRKQQRYTNEGQTVLRQAQVKLDKQSLLNMSRKKKNYISQGELNKTLQGQKQLRKKK